MWTDFLNDYKNMGGRVTVSYDARLLLADVARMVEKQKAERGITRLPVIDFPPGRR